MKKNTCLAAIVTTVLMLPTVVRAQGYPYSGSATTTIYVPSIETTTTTTTQITPSVIYPNNSFGTSTTTIYNGGGYNSRHRHRDRQIIQQQNSYPRAVQSNCSTSVIGSPIPSPIALDRSGQPCR
jgi:hypothetical protein